MKTYAGMRVYVSRPTLTYVKRTWRQRLLERPWRPTQDYEPKWLPAAVPSNAVYQIGEDLHCGVEAYDRIKKAIEENPI